MSEPSRIPADAPPTSAGQDESHLRPGEVTVALPERPDAGLYFIGRIRTPWQSRTECPKNARESRERGIPCTVEVDPRWAQALIGLESCSHLILLYWMDRARRDLVLQRPAHYGHERATFALRSPVRPNPVAIAVVKLVKVENTQLEVVGVDCLDGTPLIDIKPYFASTDCIPDATVGWHQDLKK
jgi:tRNA-Thr(GGU) m(6)t(6)A37 methyltransferase TsaA